MGARMTDLTIARGVTLPLDVVTEATAIVATRGAGKTSASVVLVEEAHKAGVQTVIFDRTGVYWGLQSNAKGTGPGLPIYVLGGAHADVPLEAAAGAMVADLAVDTGHSFVLDLSDFSKAQATRFAADFLERIYDRKARARTTTLLVMDEAHFYAPQTPRGGFKGDGARLMGAMEDVVGLGRSRGLGVVLTTQRTQSLNKAVLDLIETLLVMRMLSPRARDAVKDWMQVKHEDDELGVLASLDGLPTGTAWVWSPLRGILQRVAVRRIHTFDSYETPKPGQVQTEPKARQELDLTALGEQIAATVERAKADDPRTLRQRIADLERQLAAALADRPEPEQVEVEVLTDDDWIALSLYRERLQDAAGALAEEAARAREIANKIVQANATTTTSTAARVAAAPAPVRLPAASPPRPAPPQARPSEVDGQEWGLTPARAKILDALASLVAIGVESAPKGQIALWAGVSPKSSGFANNLGALRTAGLIDYPASGRVCLTDQGRAAVGEIPPPMSNAELHAQVQTVVSPARWKILDVLIDVYPEVCGKQWLAEQAGVSPASSGYANNLGALRSLGLIEYPGTGSVVAADMLFIERR